LDYEPAIECCLAAGLLPSAVREPRLDFRAACRQLADFDLIVSSRFHAVVVGNIMDKATFGVYAGDYYKHKMLAAAQDFPRSHALSLPEMNAVDAANAILEAMGQSHERFQPHGFGRRLHPQPGGSLETTLHALGGVAIPAGWRAELIVVDNASTDDTALVLQNAHLPNLAMRCLREPRQGVSRARNRGLAAAGGEVILFTDDDVAPAGDWLERLATPLWQGDCDAAVGRIELAAELSRPWMQARHKRWLAAPDLSVDQMTELIGANMGFHRRVLERVPAFDPELGTGALGSGEETLFSFNSLRPAIDCVLFRTRSWCTTRTRTAVARPMARNSAETGPLLAYILHHWEHAELKWPFIRFCYMALKLGLRRATQPPPPVDAEGIPDWEMSYVVELEEYRNSCRNASDPGTMRSMGS